MVKYREILRLHSLGQSQRTIRSSAHCSDNTVRTVLEVASQKGIQWPLDDDITNADLERMLFPDKYKSACLYIEPDYPYIHRELAKRGVTLTLLWEEYRRTCYDEGKKPYMFTQFGEKYRKWARVTKATMRIQHKPGDAIEVDWAGDTIPIFDSVTGEKSKAYLFVAVLPCSYYTYAEVCGDTQTENWLNCHVHAFNYFGGATRLLIPDNCKTATSSNTRYDVVVNRSYQELAEYYGTAIVPTRVRKPKDKSAAEASVNFAETWIIAALRDRKFFTVREAQEAAAEKLEECINRREFAICTEKTCHSIGDFPPPRRPPFHQKALPAIPPTELGDTNLLLRVLEYCTAVTFFPKAQCAATACGFQHPSRGTFR